MKDYKNIQDNFEKEFGNMKFDVIIGNPPYQLSDGGGTSGSAVPLYDKFINKSLELNPRYLSMIVPSRWMIGGRGLTNFRNKMIKDKRIKNIVDYELSSDVFSSQGFDGGVSYFLWDKNYSGKVNYKYQDKKGDITFSHRYLKNDLTDTVIRDIRRLSIIKKSLNGTPKTFNSIVSSSSPFGYRSDLLNNPKRYNVEIYNSTSEEDMLCRILGLEGPVGGSKRTYKYIKRSDILKNKESIDKYKLFFSKAFNLRMTVPPEIVKGFPLDICTETFLKIGDFSTEEEMNNCLSYMKTKFFRALFYYKRHSLNTTSDTFSLIPLQDFSKPWTDEELYKKYKLTEEEIAYIEDNIDPMGDQEDLEEAYPEDSVDLEEEEFEDEDGEEETIAPMPTSDD